MTGRLLRKANPPLGKTYQKLSHKYVFGVETLESVVANSQVVINRQTSDVGTGRNFSGNPTNRDLGDGAFSWSLYKVVRFHRISVALDFLRFVGIVDEPKYDSESQGRTSQGSNGARCGLVEIKKDKSANNANSATNTTARTATMAWR